MLRSLKSIRVKVIVLAISTAFIFLLIEMFIFLFNSNSKEKIEGIASQDSNKEVSLLIDLERLKSSQIIYTTSHNEAYLTLGNTIIKKRILPFINGLTKELSEKISNEEREATLNLKHSLSELLKTDLSIEAPAKSFGMSENVDSLHQSSIAPDLNSYLKKVEPFYLEIVNNASVYFNAKKRALDVRRQAVYSNFDQLNIIAACLLVVGISTIVILTSSFSKEFNLSFSKVSHQLEELAHGGIPEKVSIEPNEIGELIKSANTIAENLNKASHFALAIGEGKYDLEFNPSSDKDKLSNSLIQMRQKLMNVTEEDKIRNWSVEGLARIVEIVRSNNNDFKVQLDNILKYLVEYVGAHQGGLFILNNEEEDNEFLELKSCYAFERKKYINKRVEIGDGLVGQAYLERDKIYMVDIPEDYVKIKSGMGEADPSSVLIVPLKVNEKVEGIVELASFRPFKKYEIEFVEKIGETIASAISSIKIAEKTSMLLQSSQEHTEQMRAQEEEMRQSLEELQATQEQMQRKENEMQKLLEDALQRKAELEAKAREMEEVRAEELRQERIKEESQIKVMTGLEERLEEKVKIYQEEIEALKKELEVFKPKA